VSGMGNISFPLSLFPQGPDKGDPEPSVLLGSGDRGDESQARPTGHPGDSTKPYSTISKRKKERKKRGERKEAISLVYRLCYNFLHTPGKWWWSEGIKKGCHSLQPSPQWNKRRRQQPKPDMVMDQIHAAPPGRLGKKLIHVRLFLDKDYIRHTSIFHFFSCQNGGLAGWRSLREAGEEEEEEEEWRERERERRRERRRRSQDEALCAT
jgi:hypothetical protein